jgi:ferric-dicitrate binding protein FerR (iron transport regulator)
MEFKLIIKKINGTLTKNEEAIFKDWYTESETHRAYFRQVQKQYSEGSDMVDVQKGWKTVSSKIEQKKNPNTFWKYAAAVAAFVLLGGLAYFNKKEAEPDLISAPVVKSSSIQIGTDKATLTLEDGSQVALGKGKSYKTEKVSSNGEELVYKAPSGHEKGTVAHNILTIPRGGQFFVTLADGTRVWLNSESQLRYPVAFTVDGPRTVELIYGEAYFEVSPARDHEGSHFLVGTHEQIVDVLGTEFNVKAYKEDAFVATTLVEGKVLVKKGPAAKTLRPGHQSRLNLQTSEIDVVTVDVYNEISWKNGFFSFKDKPLEDIMAVLSRWYDFNVVFKNDAIKKATFNGVFRKSQQLDEILSAIENTKEVTYTMNQKTITMEKNR